MMLTRYEIITPDELLDYGWDWSTWLGADTIAVSAWEIVAANGSTAPAIDSHTNDADAATVWLDAGACADGDAAYVVNKITTAAGREAARTFGLRVQAYR